MPAVGTILVATPAVWQGEPPVVIEGSVTTVTATTLYLGNSASNVNDFYTGMFLVILRGPSGFNDRQYITITGYNGSTKNVTVAGWGSLPVSGNTWKIIKEYPIQRSWQWYRDGVAIPNQNSLTYTTENVDAGTHITVTETAGKIKDTNLGFTLETPAITGSISSGIVSIEMGTVNSRLVYGSNINYLGSFKIPPAGTGVQSTPAYADGGISIKNTNGVKTLIVRSHVYTDSVGEFGLNVALKTSGSYVDLNSAPLVSPTSATAPLPSLLPGADPAGASEDKGVLRTPHHIPGSSKMLVSYYGPISPADVQVHYRRPADIYNQDPAQIEGPFVISDNNYQPITRWNSGWYCNVPADWQQSLGGNILASGTSRAYTSISFNPAVSHGPCATSFWTTDIDIALQRKNKGIIRTITSQPTLKQLQLDSTASSQDGYYVNDYLNIPGVFPYARKIISYSGATKTATFSNDAWGTFGIPVPAAGQNYIIIPNVPGNQLVGYTPANPLQASLNGYGQFMPIWNFSTSGVSPCIPDGTDSLLFFSKTGDGLYTYTQVSSPPYVSDYYRVYDPGSDNPGPHTWPDFIKVHAYRLADLAAVKSNPSVNSFNSVKPYGIFTIKLPVGFTGYSRRSIRGVVYEPESKRVYLADAAGPSESLVIHVFEITNASYVGLPILAPQAVSPPTLVKVETAGSTPTVVINTPPVITTPLLQLATVGVNYNFQLSATGTPNNFTWAITSGNKPAWLTLSSSGLLSGTPTASDVTSGISLTFSCSNGITPNATLTASLGVQLNAGRQIDNTTDPVLLSEISASRLANQATFGNSIDLMNYIKSKDSNSQVAAAKWVQEQLSFSGANLSEYRALVRGGSIIHDYDEVKYLYPKTWQDVPASEGGPVGTLNTSGIYAGQQIDSGHEWQSFGTGTYPVIVDFFRNATDKPDQIRQRIAFFLSQIFVASDNTVKASYGLARFQQKFLDNALGNYRNLIVDIIKDPFMGEFLTSVNNDKAGPNENFAREILQLFTLGNCVLNMNGTYATLDQIGNDPGPSDPGGTGCVPTYDNNLVREFAFALSGWTYPLGANKFQILGPVENAVIFPWCNVRYYGSGKYPNNLGPNNMVNKDGSNLSDIDYQDPVKFKKYVGHGRPDDTPTSKPKIQLFSGPAVAGADFNIPAITGLTRRNGEAALQKVVDAIMSHQNLWPWVSVRFIRHFVTSNPSKEYIHRVATAFKNGTYTNSGITFGTGVKGDMKALIAAVLLDTEARQLNNPRDNLEYGKLREPVLFYTAYWRALNGKSDGLGGFAANGGTANVSEQAIFRPPSVFNYYNLLYTVPGLEVGNPPRLLAGPEFGILSTNTMNWRFSEISRQFLSEKNTGDQAGPTYSLPMARYDNAYGYEKNLDVFAPWAGGPGLAGILTLINRMDVVLCHGQLTKEEKDAIALYVKQSVDDLNGGSPTTIIPGQPGYKKVKLRIIVALAAIFTSKSFNILK